MSLFIMARRVDIAREWAQAHGVTGRYEVLRDPEQLAGLRRPIVLEHITGRDLPLYHEIMRATLERDAIVARVDHLPPADLAALIRQAREAS